MFEQIFSYQTWLFRIGYVLDMTDGVLKVDRHNEIGENIGLYCLYLLSCFLLIHVAKN